MPSTDTGAPTLFPFAVNWRDSYHVIYEFKTDVFTSRSGREQRRAQRSTPRKQLQFSITQETSSPLNRFLYREQGSSITVADRSRIGRITEAVTAGSSVIVVCEMPTWMVPTVSIVLGGALHTVASISGNTATLVEPAGADLHPNTPFYPAVNGRLSDSFSLKNVSDRVAEASVTVALDPGGNTPDDSGSPQEVFNGREVFVFEPNWASPIEGQFARNSDAVDFLRGRIQVYHPINFSTRIRQFSVLFPTQRDRVGAVSFFHRMKGQRGEFYLPSWDDALDVVHSATAGSTMVTVAGDHATDTTLQAVVLRLADGAQFYRRIVSITSDGTNSVLQTDAPWPVAIDANVQLTWLQAARFAADQLDVECVTSEVSRTQFSTRTLEDLPVLPSDNPWNGLDDGAWWLIDFYGWRFIRDALANPLHRWLHVSYPKTAGLAVFLTGEWWLNRFYGQPYATNELATPLHTLIHRVLPES
ncbi:hypothetical protein [Sphingomonas sp. TREG-RG-20F-R18-01]|uniref:hypothetical protein n=1 Tax=Sphingomonas sp. TREG-RG-20F-R18-01 TaxID=2914982 RepID=UPI001F5A3C2C|nr:hypothetical protein [Sphingomonas sp. TREG-RG-20F-R18-01]